LRPAPFPTYGCSQARADARRGLFSAPRNFSLPDRFLWMLPRLFVALMLVGAAALLAGVVLLAFR
jgi:hypothetical protein